MSLGGTLWDKKREKCNRGVGVPLSKSCAKCVLDLSAEAKTAELSSLFSSYAFPRRPRDVFASFVYMSLLMTVIYIASSVRKGSAQNCDI